MRMATNGADLHSLARWVENLPADDQRMVDIAAAAELDYGSGAFRGSAASESLIDSFHGGDSAEARDRWLDDFAAAVGVANA